MIGVLFGNFGLIDRYVTMIVKCCFGHNPYSYRNPVELLH